MKEYKATNLDYDMRNDSLYIYTKERKYKGSLDLEDIIIDISEDGEIIGIEILDASKKFKIPKYGLKNIVSFKSIIEITKDVIKINMKIAVLRRNKKVEKSIIAKGLNEMNLAEGVMAMTCWIFFYSFGFTATTPKASSTLLTFINPTFLNLSITPFCKSLPLYFFPGLPT